MATVGFKGLIYPINRTTNGTCHAVPVLYKPAVEERILIEYLITFPTWMLQTRVTGLRFGE